MKTIFTASLLFLCCVASFGHTLFRPSAAGQFDFKVEGARNASWQISAPDWIETTVTEVTTNDLKSVTLTMKYAPTIAYRTAKIIVTLGLSEYEVEFVQSGSLQTLTTEGGLISEQVPHSEILQAWFAPDDGEVLPALRFYPTRAGAIFEFVPRPGWLYVQTARGTFSARTTYS